MPTTPPVTDWKGGHLRVLIPWPRPSEAPCVTEGAYRPIGAGLAIPDEPLTTEITEPPSLRGIQLEFDLRGERLACVAIRSPAGAEGLTSTSLRQLGPAVRAAAQRLFEANVVRLIALDDDTVAGELAWQRVADIGVQFGALDEDVQREMEKRRPRIGRPPLEDAKLRRVAELALEADRQGVGRTAYILEHFPHNSHETIRKWVQIARDREFLPRGNRPAKPGGTR